MGAMRTIYVALPSGALERLRDLALREFRGAKEQAAVLILEGLERHAADKTREATPALESPRSE